MSNSQTSQIKSYAQAAAYLAKGRGGADCEERPAPSAGQTTRIVRRSATSIAVRQHDTNIVTFHKSGRIVFDNGSWWSVTTKAKMNEYSPIGIGQTNGVWYVSEPNPEYDHDAPYVPPTYDVDPETGVRSNYVWPAQANDGIACWIPAGGFANGMSFYRGKLSGHVTPEAMAAKVRENNAIKARIRKYVKLYTDERIVELITDADGASAGDCFICRTFRADCIESHMEEKYTHLAALKVHAGGYFLHAANTAIKNGHPMRYGKDIRKEFAKSMRSAMIDCATR